MHAHRGFLLPIFQEEVVKEFLIWWLHDATFGEYLVIAWLLYWMLTVLAVVAYIAFWHLREWFETHHRSRK